MSNMSSLIVRNKEFASTFTPVPLGPPAAEVVVVTCLDHRVDPATFLELELGDAPVIRNAGGRVTKSVIDDVAFFAFIAARGSSSSPSALGRRQTRQPRVPELASDGSHPSGSALFLWSCRP